MEWRECLRWLYEEKREEWRRNAHLYRTAGKSFKDFKEPNWRELEPDWDRLFPDRKPSKPVKPTRTQRELWMEALASGRLALADQTRHLRKGTFEEAQKWLKSQ